MWVAIILFVLLLFLICILKVYSRTEVPCLPEGFKKTNLVLGFPIFGILPKVKHSLHYYLRGLSSEFGSLFRVRIGMRDVFIVNDFEMMTKVFKENADIFSWRLRSRFSSLVTHEAGILFTDGKMWKDHRAFALKVIREVGFGNSKYQTIVQEECIFFIEQLENREFDVSLLISVCIANITSKFLMRKRFAPDDNEMKLIKDGVDEIGKKRDRTQLFDLMFPMFDKWNWLWWILARNSKTLRIRQELYPLFRKQIEEHKRNLDANSEGEDYIDRFLIKQQEEKQLTGDFGTFSDWHLLRDLFELFIAGYDSTSTTLLWGCFFMAKNQKIQQIVHSEIIEKIGEEKLVDMSDKKYLPYIQAVIDEIFRLSSGIPLSIPHRNIDDAYIDHFYIPKNSIIFPNIFACHTDPLVWEKPLKFYPEHFLSLDNDGNRRYTPREELIPFGVGRRLCLGESLAKLEFFIFFTTMLQRYRIDFEQELSDEKYEKLILGHEGFIRSCGVHNFIFHRR